MLRQHNKDIKITTFVIGGECKVDKFAKDLNINVVHRESSGEYFCLNRRYMNECEEDSVLHIDGDTFIYGDIEKIFDKYKDKDFAGATDDWITGTPDWEGMSATYRELGFPEVPVFNGGLTLWNNGSVREWGSKWLETYCQMCKEGNLPIGKWLYNDNRNCYHRETFAICLYVANKNLNYGIFDRKDVVNLFCQRDWLAWNDKSYIVYHCFTQNWLRFFKQLKKKVVKHQCLFK